MVGQARSDRELCKAPRAVAPFFALKIAYPIIGSSYDRAIAFVWRARGTTLECHVALPKKLVFFKEKPQANLRAHRR